MTLPILLILIAFLGCGEPASESPVETPAVETPVETAAADVYRLRGVVRQLPSPPAGELLIHHEAIPAFRTAQGDTTAMEAMSMPFPVADPALLDDVAVGDKIAFTLEVDWEGDAPMRVTEVEKLAPETRLGFEKPAEPADDP